MWLLGITWGKVGEGGEVGGKMGGEMGGEVGGEVGGKGWIDGEL